MYFLVFLDFYFSFMFFGSIQSFPNLLNMFLLLYIIVTQIKENVIAKLQKLYSSPRNLRVGSKSLMLFVKKLLCTGDLSPAYKIFTERPEVLTFSFESNIASKKIFVLLVLCNTVRSTCHVHSSTQELGSIDKKLLSHLTDFGF